MTVVVGSAAEVICNHRLWFMKSMRQTGMVRITLFRMTVSGGL